MIRASLNIHLCSTGILSKGCLNSEIDLYKEKRKRKFFSDRKLNIKGQFLYSKAKTRTISQEIDFGESGLSELRRCD